MKTDWVGVAWAVAACIATVVFLLSLVATDANRELTKQLELQRDIELLQTAREGYEVDQ